MRPRLAVFVGCLCLVMGSAGGTPAPQGATPASQEARPAPRAAKPAPSGSNIWVAAWAASAHGPYPSGNASAGPDLGFAFPDPAVGASDQTLRLMVRPGLWGGRVRLRFANTFGSRPVTLNGVFVGLQASGGRVARGTSRRVLFAGREAVTIPPGELAWSDAAALDFFDASRAALFEGRRLAVSFHVAGASGPITWHAKALTTSYVSPPGSGAHGAEEGDSAFCYTAASWFFLDAVDVLAPRGTKVVAAFGDSITDGTATTMNGDDRWPDLLAARLRAAGAEEWVVVNQGIGGNRVTGPEHYSAATPFAGGPSALERLQRDVLGLSGLAAIIWLEGINDLARDDTSAEQVMAGMREVVRRVRERGIRICGATITSSLGSPSGAYGSAEVDRKRRAVNAFIRGSGVFDAVFDFDAATVDAATGGLRAEFQPNSTSGGPGDRLHPNRAGQMAMAAAIDPRILIR
jgi:lysophospholipase L1-like esterase